MSEATPIVDPYTAYGYERMLKDAKALEARYPDLIRLDRAGTSVEGRDLLTAELGKGARRIFICGTLHAREYIAASFLMFMMERYARTYEARACFGGFNIRRVLDHITFSVMPMVNPDGVCLAQNGFASAGNSRRIARMPVVEGAAYGFRAWKSNINGVDLNRNFPVNWTRTHHAHARASARFRGRSAFSEPETRYMAAYIRGKPFQAYLSFHAQGEEVYWSKNTLQAFRIARRVCLETGFALFRDVSENPDGGSFLEYIEACGQKPFLTVELCPYMGPYPFPDADFDRVWEAAGSICLIVAGQILRPLYHRPEKEHGDPSPWGISRDF
jgi:g-D-glutamyl-meso-diaminopimelate peptidase